MMTSSSSFVVLCGFIAMVFSAPQLVPSGSPAVGSSVVDFQHEHNPDGTYVLNYTLSDGHKRVEKGFFKNVTANADPNDPKAAKAGVVMGVTGSYEWLGPDGNTYHTDFTADETGYHPRQSVKKGAAASIAGVPESNVVDPVSTPSADLLGSGLLGRRTSYY